MVFDFFNKDVDGWFRIVGFGEESVDDRGEILWGGNILVFLLLLLWNGNIDIVDNFCVKVVIEDWDELFVEGGGVNLGVGFWRRLGLFFIDVLVVVFCSDSFFGSDGRGFFGGKGFDLLFDFRILGDKLGIIVFFCFDVVDLRGSWGDRLSFILLFFRGIGGDILFFVLVIL